MSRCDGWDLFWGTTAQAAQGNWDYGFSIPWPFEEADIASIEDLAPLGFAEVV